MYYFILLYGKKKEIAQSDSADVLYSGQKVFSGQALWIICTLM
jgi:hypothetical protein